MKKTGLWVLVVIVALIVLAVAGVHRWFNPPAPAAQLFFNGTVLTMDPQQPVADAMPVKRGGIVALGAGEVLGPQGSRDASGTALAGGPVMRGGLVAA